MIVGFHLGEAENTKVSELAEATKRSRSDIIRELIRRARLAPVLQPGLVLEQDGEPEPPETA
jgi:Ribbon-helix-helix protein, copG family